MIKYVEKCTGRTTMGRRSPPETQSVIAVRKCSKCNSPLSLSTLAECAGSAHSYSVRFWRVPILICHDSSHPLRFVAAEFGLELINHLHDALPLARRRILRRSSCRRCGAALSGKTTLSPTVFEVAVEISNAPSFSVALSGRTLTCTQCGLEQLAYDKTFYAEMPDAVLAAFSEVNLQR